LEKRIAELTGFNSAQGIGKWLGTGIGSIFGSGDYVAMGPTPSYNILQGQTPKFSSSSATNVVCHREYLGDVSGNLAFTNASYPLNPGISSTFPWLSSIAANYQQYRFHGLVFEFRPLITDFITSGSPGVIVITTNYNSDQQAYASRQEAENAEFAVSVKPTNGLMHMIECDPTETQMKLYNVRTGTLPIGSDIRTYDYGNTQVITQNNPTQVLGELWVSYCVEFFKPILPSAHNVEISQGVHAYRTNVSTSSPLGLIANIKTGALNTVITPTSVTINGVQPGTRFLFSLLYNVATATGYGLTITGATAVPLFNGDTGSTFNAGGAGPFATTTTIIATSTTVVLTPAITLTIANSVDIIVSVLDPLMSN